IFPDARHGSYRVISRALEKYDAVVHVWAEILTDYSLLKDAVERHAPGEFSPGDLERVHSWCSKQCSDALSHIEERAEAKAEAQDHPEGEPSNEDEAPRAIDGLDLEERATLDREDDTILLKLLQ